jgi:hypothetical protein
MFQPWALLGIRTFIGAGGGKAIIALCFFMFEPWALLGIGALIGAGGGKAIIALACIPP